MQINNGHIDDWWCSPVIVLGGSNMTAIAMVSAPWGVVMAADGLEVIGSAPPYNITSDHALKIFPVINLPGRKLMYALAGTVGNDNGSMDIRVEFQHQAELLAEVPFKTPRDYVEHIGQKVAEAITAARFFPVQRQYPHGAEFADVCFGGCFGSTIFLAESYFFHSGGLATFRIKHYNENCGGCFFCGPEAVRKLMYDERLIPVPRSPFEKYTHRLNLSGPTVSEVRRFVVGFVEACASPEGQKISPETMIGGHTHCAVIKPRSGFQWLIPPIQGT